MAGTTLGTCPPTAIAGSDGFLWGIPGKTGFLRPEQDYFGPAAALSGRTCTVDPLICLSSVVRISVFRLRDWNCSGTTSEPFLTGLVGMECCFWSVVSVRPPAPDEIAGGTASDGRGKPQNPAVYMGNSAEARMFWPARGSLFLLGPPPGLVMYGRPRAPLPIR